MRRIKIGISHQGDGRLIVRYHFGLMHDEGAGKDASVFVNFDIAGVNLAVVALGGEDDGAIGGGRLVDEA